jgi:hypothetical protein
MATQVRWMVIGARNEALVRQYRRLGFNDVFGDARTVPLLHAGRLEHRILAFNVTAAERTWKECEHPLYQFIFDTSHPDIQLFSRRPALPVPSAAESRVASAFAAAFRTYQRAPTRAAERESASVGAH